MNMGGDKKSFIAYADWNGTFKTLPDEVAGKLIKHIFSYVNDENPETDDCIIEALFAHIKASINRDSKKWEEAKEAKSYSGRLGNLKRYNLDLYNSFTEGKITLEKAEKVAKSRKTSHSDKPRSEEVAKPAVNDSVSVNDSVNVTVLSKERESMRALDFLENNFQSRFETDFLMKYKPQIENFEKFKEDFNDKVDLEKRNYDSELFHRLGIYARSWIENQRKYNSKPEVKKVSFGTNR